MDNGCGIAKTICSICYEDLKPIIEDLQSISICGHVFHELCLQQWFEYCSNGKKKYSCPMCKQTCVGKDVARLYFQSVGDANDPMLAKKPADWIEKDPELLRSEIKRLEMRVSVLNSTLETQGKDIKELHEESLKRFSLHFVFSIESFHTVVEFGLIVIWLCLVLVVLSLGLYKWFWEDISSISKSIDNERSNPSYEIVRKAMLGLCKELENSTVECKRLHERSMALAKELAAFKLISEVDLDEEEVLKLSSLGSGADNKDTIDILRKSLVLRNRSYKELMAKCNLLGRGEARSCKKLEKANGKINKLKVRVQELEKAIEDKDNEVLRGLKDAKKLGVQGSVCCKCNMVSAKNKSAAAADTLPSTASQINEPLSSRKEKIYDFPSGTHTSYLTTVDIAENICSSVNKKTSECSQVENAKDSTMESQISEEGNRMSYHPQLTSCNLVRKKASEKTTNSVNPMPSTTTVRTAVPGDEGMPLLVEDSAEPEAVLINIRRESSSHISLNKPGGISFSGGLLGPNGSNMYLGKWCKRGQTNGSSAMQGSRSGELIAVGADGRGGQIKVLRSQNESSLSDATSAGTKRFKNGVKNVNMRIENFFSKC
ncbi:E3 ubiquitin-protein ligase TRAIP-like [Cucumis melo var. makuwa]|uniref:E3 ubiquitin-protein ligase TRAIP-like n=1 Tax=Cucumis melo var. makuwa TaxID=1194695 RepID=A0A5D3CRM0_CUCMM|nr:E3 ubiquitin-protein ligase TRAIP-like [Cucumis melo var. makuwa]